MSWIQKVQELFFLYINKKIKNIWGQKKMKIKEYIKKYGKIEVVDTKNKFIFYCDGKNRIGGGFTKGKGRIL